MESVKQTRKAVLAASKPRDQEATHLVIDTTENGRAPSDQITTANKQMSVVVVKDITALKEHLAAWDKLVEVTLEPNVFYESWMLIPALPAFGGDKDLQFVLTFMPDPARPGGPPLLCGFFPLEVHSQYSSLGRKLPIKTLSLWKHPFCYECTPLLRPEYARESLAAFFDWLAAGSHGCPLMEFGFINGDGPFYRLLVDYFYEGAKLSCITDCFTRALFIPGVDAEQYMRKALLRIRLKEFRRQERRLAETGQLEYVVLKPDGDIATWIDEFLQLEALSWKGQVGRALACNDLWKEFFETVAKEAFQRGQLMMLALRFNGRLIADKCNFLSREGSFAFKIAFDEEYARFSPGILLELENIRQLHARPEIRWMDSCADPDRLMINRLWPDRRTISTLVVGTGRSPGDLVVAAIPMLKWLNRKLLRRKLNGVGR